MPEPVAWRRPNYEWSCWDFTSEVPEDDPEGWEPLYLAEARPSPPEAVERPPTP